MSLEFLVDRMSKIPGEMFKLPYYDIEVGSIANLAVFDVDNEYTINPDDYLSKSSSTPFNGTKVFGMCNLTLYNGEVVYQSK